MLRKNAAFGFLAAGLLAGFASSLRAVEIVPASMQDILNAMGPDATGLALSQEALPDLFTLTANRIEENPKLFTIQGSYSTGRWKGGKVVLEYARDLSYTLVSVYDKEGERQRIYSVRTKYTEHVEHLKAARAQAPASVPGVVNQPNPGAGSRETETASSRPPPPSKAVDTEPGKEPEPKSSYEWDEARAAYVPVAVSAVVMDVSEVQPQKLAAPVPVAEVPVKKEESSPSLQVSKRRHHRTETRTAKAADTSQSSGEGEDKVWVPPKTSQPAVAKVQAANTPWVERRTDSSPGGSPEAPAEQPTRKRHHRVPESPNMAEKPTGAGASRSEAANAPPPVVSVAKPRAESETPTTPGNLWVPPEVSQRPSRAQDVAALKNPVVAESVPSEEELLGIKPPISKPKSPPAPVAVSNGKGAPAAASAVVASASAPTTAVAVSPAPVPIRAVEAAAVPSTEELLASGNQKSGPDTSAGDAWVPKETPKTTVPEPALPAPEPVKVAMVPKPAAVDNSVENLLKIANDKNVGAPHESDAWVPKKTPLSKSAIDLDREVARIRAQENKKAAERKTVKVRQDINNPEEGVLPVSTFEKYSGPMYGRHREYERRFVPGKNRIAKVPEHDFYVDEIDRKKEIHNIYYYIHQKGKAPRLVAVERHETVSFLGNYDIDKEDKGKISTYN